MGDPVADVKAEVVTLRAKVVAYAKAHIPHGIIGVASYVGGKVGVLGAVLSMIGKFY